MEIVLSGYEAETTSGLPSLSRSPVAIFHVPKLGIWNVFAMPKEETVKGDPQEKVTINGFGAKAVKLLIVILIGKKLAARGTVKVSVVSVAAVTFAFTDPK